MRIAYKDSTVERPVGSWAIDTIERALARTAPALIEDVVVVTSGNDGRHGAYSKHYSGAALDVRVYGARRGGIDVDVARRGGIASELGASFAELQKASAQRWRKRLANVLGLDFDVVLERDHLHVEYDPKLLDRF